ncbi:hypothetical protein DAH66_11180 [Sphingomonas koreensis]|uniref:Uncharacterized protein n=2 Tax=Sphingomonas koreensis TaxID=93064 RepID=A0A430G360_9SPHN|nr:hypothetical protein DAH66_11180 [Sphingomonas koreensis]
MAMSAAANKATGKPAWLALAAAPVFAAMALISATDAPPLSMCAGGSTLLPVDGMTAMYLLMSLFHLPPWLTLAGR